MFRFISFVLVLGAFLSGCSKDPQIETKRVEASTRYAEETFTIRAPGNEHRYFYRLRIVGGSTEICLMEMSAHVGVNIPCDTYEKFKAISHELSRF